MIQVIYGKKGSGKTKRLLDMANDALKVEHGDIVFVDDDKRGMLSQNFDVTAIFIDAFMKMVNADVSTLGDFFAQLDTLAEKRNLRFVISLSGDPDTMPEFMKKYVI